MRAINHRTEIRLALGVYLVIAFSSFVAPAQSPPRIKLERDDLLREILNGQPSLKTPWYDGTVAGSYSINKIDMANTLPEIAKAQRINLRGLLLVGPGSLVSSYYVYSFSGERAAIRVNELTMAMSRIIYKSTGRMTERQFAGFIEDLLRAGVLERGLPPNAKEKPNAAIEQNFDLLLARWSGGTVETYYGCFTTRKPGARVDQFGTPIGSLLKSLTKTFPLPIVASPQPTLPANSKDAGKP